MIANKPSVTLLFPFDIGRSYFFEPRTSQGKNEFKEMLSNGQWKADDYLLKTFQLPLGLPASLIVTQENSNQLQKVMDRIPETLFDKQSLEIEVIAFTIGSANLLVRLHLQKCFFEREESFKEWTNNALDFLAPLANEARVKYFNAMELCREVSWLKPYHEKISWLKGVDKGRNSDPDQELKKLRYSYPLFFPNKNHTFSSSRSAASVEYKHANLQISWSEAYIRGYWQEEKNRLSVISSLRMQAGTLFILWTKYYGQSGIVFHARCPKTPSAPAVIKSYKSRLSCH